jgi:3-isopropylmalate/(R)-2-methylmalate dehydratase small subunit
MATKMRGQAWLFGDILDVDYDICVVGKQRVLRDKGLPITAEALGQFCMAVHDPDFAKNVKKGDFIVAGENMGYGHDHDHACLSIKGAGVGAVLCNSTNSNFFRNCVDHGLPVVEYPGIHDATEQGDELEIDLAAGRIRNLTKQKEFEFTPYPSSLLAIIEAGGLYPRLTQQVAEGTV